MAKKRRTAVSEPHSGPKVRPDGDPRAVVVRDGLNGIGERGRWILDSYSSAGLVIVENALSVADEYTACDDVDIRSERVAFNTVKRLRGTEMSGNIKLHDVSFSQAQYLYERGIHDIAVGVVKYEEQRLNPQGQQDG